MTTTLENLHLSMGISPNIERLFKKTNGSHDYNHMPAVRTKTNSQKTQNLSWTVEENPRRTQRGKGDLDGKKYK